MVLIQAPTRKNGPPSSTLGSRVVEWSNKRAPKRPQLLPAMNSLLRSESANPSRTRDDVHLDGCFHVGMQRDLDVIIAEIVDRAFRHDDFALFQREALRSERLGDIARTDRTEQLALGTGVGTDRGFGIFQLRAARLSIGKQFVGLGLVFGALLLEGIEVGLGGRHGLALRHQVVAAVARLHPDLVAEGAEVLHFLEKDDFHKTLRFVSASREAQPKDGCPNVRRACAPIRPSAIPDQKHFGHRIFPASGGRNPWRCNATSIKQNGCRNKAATRETVRAAPPWPTGADSAPWCR